MGCMPAKLPQLCLTLQLHGLQPTRLLCPWDSPGKNTGVGCHALLWGIFLTQGLNLHLLWFLHCRQILPVSCKDLDTIPPSLDSRKGDGNTSLVLFSWLKQRSPVWLYHSSNSEAVKDLPSYNSTLLPIQIGLLVSIILSDRNPGVEESLCQNHWKTSYHTTDHITHTSSCFPRNWKVFSLICDHYEEMYPQTHLSICIKYLLYLYTPSSLINSLHSRLIFSKSSWHLNFYKY